MRKIIYRKNDLQCVGTVPENMGVSQEIELNVIPNFGGAEEDYEVFETDKDNFHLKKIDGVITPVENSISPQPPTTDDYLLDLDFRLSMIELGL